MNFITNIMEKWIKYEQYEPWHTAQSYLLFVGTYLPLEDMFKILILKTFLKIKYRKPSEHMYVDRTLIVRFRRFLWSMYFLQIDSWVWWRDEAQSLFLWQECVR